MSTFHFQQFSVEQSQSGMKVCTDSVLFGAMAPIKAGANVLDIGTGTGLLSLMAAQLGAAQVTAVELTLPAYHEALLNFNNSPWANRLCVIHQDIQQFSRYHDAKVYDLIICNPPFFEKHLKTTDALRQTARHTDQLPFEDLVQCVEYLLAETGLFYVLLPAHAVEKFTDLAQSVGLYLNHQTDFKGYEHNDSKVSALRFHRTPQTLCKKLHTIYQAHRIYSKDSETYLADFLLRFAKKP